MTQPRPFSSFHSFTHTDIIIWNLTVCRERQVQGFCSPESLWAVTGTLVQDSWEAGRRGSHQAPGEEQEGSQEPESHTPVCVCVAGVCTCVGGTEAHLHRQYPSVFSTL